MNIGLKLELITLKDSRRRRDLVQMFEIMNKMDKCERYNRLKIILIQVRSHCFKSSKKLLCNYTEKIS
jgi:hypothetical protein